MVNSGVVAAIHVLGMRCDPCDAVRPTLLKAKIAQFNSVHIPTVIPLRSTIICPPEERQP